MSMTVGDFIVQRLHAWGVRRIFGYPGDGINGVFGALNRAKGSMEFIQARHEEMAAFMASAHAKFTGELGVCIATSGPGASHLVTGLYDARLDHQPVLAITGQQAIRKCRRYHHISLSPRCSTSRKRWSKATRTSCVVAGMAKQLLGVLLPGRDDK